MNTKYITIGLIVLAIALVIIFREKLTSLLTPKKDVDSTSNATSNTNATTQQPYQLQYNKVLKKGVNGEEVKLLQTWLQVNADGAFGPITEGALKDRKGVIQTTLTQYPNLPDLEEVEADVTGSNFSWALPSTWFS